MQLEKKERTAFEIFDCHIHIGFGQSIVGKKKDDFFVSFEEMIQYLNRFGIQKGLIFPFPNPKISSIKTNEYIVKCVNKCEEKLYGLLYFSWNEDPEELIQFINPNIVGIGEIHSSFSRRSLAEIPDTLLEIIKEKKWILLIDSSISELGHPRHVVKFAKDNPDIPIICAHMARLFHEEILVIAELENVYLDISGINILSKDSCRLAPPNLRYSSLRGAISPCDILEYLLRFVGRKKIVWGSDFPFPQFFGGRLNSELYFILKEAASLLDKETYQDIMGNNLKFLLKKIRENK